MGQGRHTLRSVSDPVYPQQQHIMSFSHAVAVETHGPLSVSTVSFLVDLGRKISERTGKPLEVYSVYSSGSAS